MDGALLQKVKETDSSWRVLLVRYNPLPKLLPINMTAALPVVCSQLSLKFGDSSGTCAIKGPFNRIRFDGEVIRADIGGAVIACHEDHHWDVDGKRCVRLDIECAGSLEVHFESSEGTHSETLGPFDSVSFVDGIAYADRKVCAFADRAIKDWYCHSDGRHYPHMIVQIAGISSTKGRG